MKRVRFLFVILFLIYGQAILAQDHNHDDLVHTDHTHPKNELGIANNLTYLGNEGELAYGLHLHFIRNIGESPFGYGLGYEQIFDDHLHRNLSIIGSYTPVEHLFLTLSPGITFIGREKPEKTFALHLEATYEYELGAMHIGPVAGYSISGHGYHISLGLHLAYAF